MKTALVSFAVGPLYERIERVTGPFRQRYADRHGYSYHVVSRLPQELIERFPDKGIKWYCVRAKLILPTLFQEYENLIIMDGDSFIMPDAPDLMQFEEMIPSGGFAAANTITHAERRKYFPDWSESYYDPLKPFLTEPYSLTDETKYINSGLLMCRPREVAERWSALCAITGILNEENLLNTYEVQQGMCFFLNSVDAKWHVLWFYEKHRRNALLPARKSPFSPRFLWKTVKNRIAWPFWEPSLFSRCCRDCHFIHLAFEAKKCAFLSRAI